MGAQRMAMVAPAPLSELLAPPPFFNGPTALPQHRRTWRSKVGFLPEPLRELDSPVPRKWSLSLPPVRRAVQRRCPNDLVEPLERDRLFEGLGLRQRQRSSGSAILEPMSPPPGNLEEQAARGRDFAEERRSHIREIEALRRRCGDLESSLASEEVRRIEAEQALKNGIQSVSLGARTKNCKIFAMLTARAAIVTEQITLSAVFGAWSTRVSEARIKKHMGSTRVEARRRAFNGGLAWAATTEKTDLLLVLAAWRSSTSARRQVASLQEKLFAEEACRGAALRTQQNSLEALHMEADARHKSALRRVRAELVLAETRHVNDMALQEAEALRAVHEVVSEQQVSATRASADALREAQAFALAAAELLAEEAERGQEAFALATAELLKEEAELEEDEEDDAEDEFEEDSLEDFVLAAAELLQDQDLDDSLAESQDW